MNHNQANQGREKRQQARVSIDAEINVKDTVTGADLGVLANLHGEGFMLISDGGLREDRLYQVALHFIDQSSITLGAECLWISETGTGDQIWAGFQIVDIADDAKLRIEQMIAQNEQS